MNICIITGRLTRDVDLQELQGGTKVGRFAIAVNGEKDKNGERHVDFFNCQAWNRTAETLAKYFHKGDPIEVVGRMQSSKKDDKTYWTLNVREWSFAQTQKSAETNTAHSAVENGLREATAEEAEDLPF